MFLFTTTRKEFKNREEKAIRTVASHRADWTSPYTVKIFECDLRQMVILSVSKENVMGRFQENLLAQ
jgi:hypothetical protein